jgi:hypothetical protein
MNKLILPYKKVKIGKRDVPAKKGEGLQSLPDCNMRENFKVENRILWNIYKVFRKEEYYYHTKPFNSNDIIYQKNIDVSTAVDRVRFLNNKNKD